MGGGPIFAFSLAHTFRFDSSRVQSDKRYDFYKIDWFVTVNGLHYSNRINSNINSAPPPPLFNTLKTPVTYTVKSMSPFTEITSWMNFHTIAPRSNHDVNKMENKTENLRMSKYEEELYLCL